jgi:hypothetical protein
MWYQFGGCQGHSVTYTCQAKTNKSSFENESVGVLLLQARFHKTVFLNDDFVFYLRFFKVNRSVGFNVLLFYYGS